MHSIVVLFLSAGILAVSCAYSASGIQKILDAHNNLKSKIARGVYVAKGKNLPKGANILKYKWDDGIATIAQKYADTCPRGHSYNPGLGENLYWSWCTVPFQGDLDRFGVEASKSWENEFQYFGLKSIKFDVSVFNSGVAHATQMAWASTDLIGCGYKECKNGEKFEIAVVCNYKPQGNIIGVNMYMEGPTCSACPPGKKCETATGLCV